MKQFLERHPMPVRSVWRRVHEAINPSLFHTIHINEFPKSGGSWVCNMVNACLGYRFDDNAYPWFGDSVIKYHRLSLSRRNMITVIRDPRDVYVSFYFHCRKVFDNDGWNRHSVAMMEKHYFNEDRSEEEEINYFVRALQKDPIFPSFTWQQFYSHPSRGDSIFLRYEDLRTDTESELVRVFSDLGVEIDREIVNAVAERYNISNILADRKSKPNGAHFVRKGIVGNYVEYLTENTIDFLEQSNYQAMKKFGYSN